MAFEWKNSLLLLFLPGLLLIPDGLSGQETGLHRYDDMLNVKSNDLLTFPQFVVESSEQSAPGYYLFDISTYMGIIDHFGNPLFYMETPVGSRNFESQPDGSYSYYDNTIKGFLVMNNYFQITDTITRVNNKSIDFHEFIILENGNYILMSLDQRVIDMSLYVEGGNPSATVTGMIFYELDPDKNPIFQWNSWDHFNVLESDTFFVDFTGMSIDYVHSNSITIDYDGNFLLSSRHLSELTKINRVTGEIIWRMGGAQNEFNFVNDTIGFSGQHSVIRLLNGNIALFDNGNEHEPQYSRGLEYEINEVEKTALLVRECRMSPGTFSSIMGSIASMPGNHLLVGWSVNSEGGFISEFDEEGQMITNIRILPEETFTWLKSYKASYLDQFQFFDVPEKDTIDFGYVETEDSAILFVELINQGTDPATLFAFSDESEQFGLLDSLPINIEGGGAHQISLKFQPTASGNYFTPVYLHFRLDSTIDDDHMLACRLMLQGSSSETSSTGEYQTGQGLNIFPNPFHEVISIENTEDVISVVIWSMTGKKVFQMQNENQKHLILDQNHLNPGIYIIDLLHRDGTREFMKVIKSR